MDRKTLENEVNEFASMIVNNNDIMKKVNFNYNMDTVAHVIISEDAMNQNIQQKFNEINSLIKKTERLYGNPLKSTETCFKDPLVFNESYGVKKICFLPQIISSSSSQKGIFVTLTNEDYGLAYCAD